MIARSKDKLKFRSAARRWFPILFCLLIPMAARANPYVLEPSSLLAFGVVAFWALVVEAGIVALFLSFSGLAPLKMFFGFCMANVAAFLFVFCPLQRHLGLPLVEAVIVCVDAVAIKLLSGLSGFQGEDYRRVSWLFAGTTALVGNAASFFVGVIATRAPWVNHGTGD